ncbi:hypothetical protein G20c_101 [Thermus phage G20c]|nr:hypothetical protein G20c_101 [Thermus phage G20c]
MDQFLVLLIERFGVLGLSIIALAMVSRWFVSSYEEKEARITKLLDEREQEIKRLVGIIDAREQEYRNDIKELSDKFIASLERISTTIDNLTQKIEALSIDVRQLKGRRREATDKN